MRSIIIPIAMCVTTLLVAQQHTTFPNVDAYFEVMYWCAVPEGGGYTMSYGYSYSFEPVVAVDSLVWSALDSGYGLVAVEGDRIYYRGNHFLPADTTMVLYDFNLEIGDTAYFDTYMFHEHAMITAIDTVTVYGQQRRRLVLSNEDVWIQGIGSLMGFFRPIQPTMLGCGISAYYFCGNYVDDAGEPYVICTNFSVHIDEKPPLTITVHPNPSNGSFVVKGTTGGVPYAIHDGRGRLVLAGTFSETSTTIHLQGSPPGIYLLRWGGGTLKLVVD